jgi:hypothetical protein
MPTPEPLGGWMRFALLGQKVANKLVGKEDDRASTVTVRKFTEKLYLKRYIKAWMSSKK